MIQLLDSARNQMMAYGLSSFLDGLKIGNTDDIPLWIGENLSMTVLQTDNPGPISFEKTPYLIPLFDYISDGITEEMTLCFGAQCAKTTFLMAAVAWIMQNMECPLLWVTPTTNLSKDFSKNRFQPILESCESLMQKRSKDRYSYTTTSMRFGDGLISMVGSNSPANLAMRPARVLVEDETDKFPGESDEEASALELAEVRTTTFSDPLIFKTSTPTTETGAIWQSLLETNLCRFNVPCPKCGNPVIFCFNPEMSALDKTGLETTLKWSPDARGKDGWDMRKVAATAHMECPHCKRKIKNSEKLKMQHDERAKWVSTKDGMGIKKGFHLPSFYAPWKKTSFGRLAVNFLNGKNSINGLKSFITNTLAEPDLGIFSDGVAVRSGAYAVNKPLEFTEKTVKIMTVDVQVDCFYYVVREWEKGGNSCLIQQGKVDVAEELIEIQENLEIPPHLFGIDSGFDHPTIYEMCHSYSWIAMRGDDRESWPAKIAGKKERVQRIWALRKFNPLIGKRATNKKAVEIRWSNPSVKDILSRLRSPSSPIQWKAIDKAIDEEYEKQIKAEVKRKKVKRTTGAVYYQWETRTKGWPNHLFDCECMQIAMAVRYGIVSLKEQ